jgi:WD40 repeat protein
MKSRSCTNCGAASPDGRLLYSGGTDEKVKVWGMLTGKPLHPLPGHSGDGAVDAGPGGLLAGGDGAVREKVLTRKGRDGL